MITCWPLLANISKDFPENVKTMFTDIGCMCCLSAVQVLCNAGFRRLQRIHDYSNAKASDACYLRMAASDFSKKVNMISLSTEAKSLNVINVAFAIPCHLGLQLIPSVGRLRTFSSFTSARLHRISVSSNL